MWWRFSKYFSCSRNPKRAGFFLKNPRSVTLVYKYGAMVCSWDNLVKTICVWHMSIGSHKKWGSPRYGLCPHRRIHDIVLVLGWWIFDLLILYLNEFLGHLSTIFYLICVLTHISYHRFNGNDNDSKKNKQIYCISIQTHVGNDSRFNIQYCIKIRNL